MLGARLARRILLPLLALLAVLFVLLGFAAVGIAQKRVSEELNQDADRVAATLATLHMAPEHRPEILPAVAGLMDCQIVLGDYATDSAWAPEEVGRIAAGPVTLNGHAFTALRRELPAPWGSCAILFSRDRIARRRRDVLIPIALAGALGLLAALGAGLFAARRIALPVKALAASAARFAQGRFRGEVGPRGPGEVGDLQDAFLAMARQVREGEQRLRENERFAALGRLAGGIAHELRNPLTAIRMAVETSASGSEASRAEARTVALGEIDRLNRTLGELLDFVRPRKPVMADVEVKDLFEGVAALLGPQCRHLDVELVLDAAMGSTLRADKDRLTQALVNLVLNGAQAQPEGGRVRLRFRPGVIEVVDEGPGVAPEVAENLFSPFVSTKSAGIGLGLAVVAQVAAEHGARVEYAREPEGTVFRLRFPK